MFNDVVLQCVAGLFKPDQEGWITLMARKQLLGMTGAVAALGLFVLPTHAALLNPDADSFVDRGSGTSNFGSAQFMRVKNDSGTFVRKAYVRYDLSGLAFDHTTDLDAASLSMTFYDGNAGNGGTTIDWTFQVYGLNDGDAGEGWGEGTINWNNAPQNDTSNGNGVLAGATSLGTFNFVGRTQVVDFTGTGGTAVRDFVAGSSSDDLVTFIVVRDTPQPDAGNSYIHYLGTKENAGQPNVTLNLTQVPEPSTLALLGLGGLLIAHRRR